MADNNVPVISARLSMQKYTVDACRAAIRGEMVPVALGLELSRLCVIRGMRYHTGFAKELHGTLPEFTRALNARAIMSNTIPDMDGSLEETPYCIWHPEVASESTYRCLVQRYPHMAYQVARACAVAGYIDLYLELEIVPDVHVAEEARECGNTVIFNHIMAASVTYSIMDDYTRSIDATNSKPSHLNGDTAVRWMLDLKQEFTRADVEDEDDFSLFTRRGFEERYLNVTEDMGIDEYTTPKRPVYDITPLLSAPLPVNLPTVEKDLLILMAAYHGDIDRYARLRRPVMIEKEVNCCVRGIYHNTMFAIWWARQSHPQSKPAAIGQAIKARYIMNNVLEPISSNDSSSLPYLISYPGLGHPSTYRELAARKPLMMPQILRACIAGNYAELFQELMTKATKPDIELLVKHQRIIDPYFRDALRRRMEELGFSLAVSSNTTPEVQLGGCSSVTIPRDASTDLVGTSFSSSSKMEFMNGLQCDVSMVELLACLPEEWKLAEGENRHVELDYVEWPLNEEKRGVSS
ncbi:uncharacterized protein LY89DRAFT_682112 [Mollisia scopiformis]|uniref:Uncharacterized protein n=1 Tax=Mollisia scopiformis TaxID=149040 RepID=A0A194XJT2_MOLSC|nr:uncharacterized protein LY89DRAFT_682112 [Mollisia scopiformis]KUJ20369.1 hypothetical protein LY89DRAFT_682112 [Mollisia scopiformis]